ncbi:DUF3265 domain-containing protein [Vibrio vulnificus]|nr:DUF3265 domain-containing protein [Vibrio vulnificus]
MPRGIFSVRVVFVVKVVCGRLVCAAFTP